MTELNPTTRFRHGTNASVAVIAAKQFTESTSQSTARERCTSSGRIRTVCAPLRTWCDQAVTFKRCFARSLLPPVRRQPTSERRRCLRSTENLMDYPTSSVVDSWMKVVRHAISQKTRTGTFLRSGRKPQRGASSAFHLDGFGSRLTELTRHWRKLLIEVNEQHRGTSD
jgi:hypothetical protein